MTAQGASAEVDAIIAAIPDWRGPMLERLRRLIIEADPDIIEEVKWKKPSNPAGVPVWSRSGILLTGQAFKGKVKLTFARGASLPDPKRLFNASLEAGTTRAIDIAEGDQPEADTFQELIRAAVAANVKCAASRQRRSRQK